jgi:hypothetical protein
VNPLGQTTGSGSGYTVFLWILSLAVTLLMGYWAGRVGFRNGRSFGLCFLVGFLLGIIGVLVIYLVGRKSGAAYPSPPRQRGGKGPGDTGRSHRVCSHCGNIIPSDSEFCEYCSNQIGPDT